MAAASQSAPTERQTLRAVETLLRQSLPPGWELTVKNERHRGGPDSRWVLTSLDGQGVTFAIETITTPDGRKIKDALARLARTPEALPLIAAPYLSPTLRGLIAEGGASFADVTGNARIVASRPGLFVDRQGMTKNPWPPAGRLGSLKGRGAGRAMRALLDFQAPIGVRELAERAQVALGTLSRTVDLLEREGLVTRGDRGEVATLDWEKALRRWSQDYAFSTSNEVEYFLWPRALGLFVQRLEDVKWCYSATGALAAHRYADADNQAGKRYQPVAPARQIAGYVEDPFAAAESLGVRTAVSGGNVALARPFDPVVFERMPPPVDGLKFVARPQLAVDLMTGTGREPSEAEELIDWMRTDGSWRQ